MYPEAFVEINNKYTELSEKINSKICETHKALLQGKFIAINVHI